MAAKTLRRQKVAVLRCGTRRRSTSPRTHAAGAFLGPEAYCVGLLTSKAFNNKL